MSEKEQVQQTSDKKPREKRDRPNRGGNREGGNMYVQKKQEFDWDGSKITLETVIPEMPKKNARTKKPLDEDLKKTLDQLDDQISAIQAKKKKYFDELNSSSKQIKDNKQVGSQALMVTIKEKQADKKKKKEAFDVFKNDFDAVKKEIEKIYDESQKLRQKMKKLMSKDDLEARISELKHSLHNDLLTPQQEKIIIKEMEDLQKSLPHSIPLSNLEEKIKELNKKKKDLGGKMNTAYKEMKEVDEELNVIYQDLTEVKSSHDNQKQELEPLIQQKKDEFNQQIQEIRDQKRRAQQQFREQMNKYYDEEDLIRHIEWMKRKKDYLLRQEQRRIREQQKKERLEAQQKAENEEDEEEVDDGTNYYQEQIDMCQNLINYCQQLQPEKNAATEEKQEEKKDIEAELQQGAWKKEKVTLIVSKRDIQDDGVIKAGNKKNKQKQKKQQLQSNEPEKQPVLNLNHHIDILSAFSEMKVDIPLTKTELDTTIEKLNEKKKYFQELPRPEKKSKKKQQQEDDDNEEEKIKQLAKPVKRDYGKVNLDDEESYPNLEN